MPDSRSDDRVRYLEACLRDAGYWETEYGWHNGTTFIGLDARPLIDEATREFALRFVAGTMARMDATPRGDSET